MADQAPATVVRRWPGVVAIRPRRPITPGHVLVIPTVHVADVGTDPAVSALTMAAAADLAAEHSACNVITSRGSDATQTVFHLHLHVVPRRPADGLLLPWSHRQQLVSRVRINRGGGCVMREMTDRVQASLSGLTHRFLFVNGKGQLCVSIDRLADLITDMLADLTMELTDEIDMLRDERDAFGRMLARKGVRVIHSSDLDGSLLRAEIDAVTRESDLREQEVIALTVERDKALDRVADLETQLSNADTTDASGGER